MVILEIIPKTCYSYDIEDQKSHLVTRTGEYKLETVAANEVAMLVMDLLLDGMK